MPFIALSWKSSAAGVQKFAHTMAPIEALRAWFLLFVDTIATKQLIAPPVNTLLSDPRRYSKPPTRRCMKRFARLCSVRSRAVTYAKISIPLKYFALLSVFPTPRPPRLAAECEKTGGYPHQPNQNQIVPDLTPQFQMQE